YRFVDTQQALQQAIDEQIGYPCVVKPVMSSSGKGQSLIRSAEDVAQAWQYSQEGGRVGKGRIIVEGFIHFDYEITLLTVRARDPNSGAIVTHFCEPIGHRQEAGEYVESWQPQDMTAAAVQRDKEVRLAVTDALQGLGVFGVELFVAG